MIDEKKLIEYINNMSDECNLFRWRSAKKIKEGLRDIIQRQPQIGGWIPCSERLPNESGSYLVTTYSNGISQYISDIDYFVYNGMPDGYWVNGEDVIAWQSLPKAYKPK